MIGTVTSLGSDQAVQSQLLCMGGGMKTGERFLRGMDSVSLLKQRISLIADLHQFPKMSFGSIDSLLHPETFREPDTLFIACSELGSAPDNISFAPPERFTILQHLAATLPSKIACDLYEELSCEGIQQLFETYDFQHVIICGHLQCQVIQHWLQPASENETDVGKFRLRFQSGTRDLVDHNYLPDSAAERFDLMVFEHVLCQIDNLLTHPFIFDRVQASTTSIYGWVIDNDSARVYGYRPEESAFVLI